MLGVLDSPTKPSPSKKHNPTKPKMMEVPKEMAASTIRPQRRSLLLEEPFSKEHSPKEKLPPSCRKAHESMLLDFRPVKLT